MKMRKAYFIALMLVSMVQAAQPNKRLKINYIHANDFPLHLSSVDFLNFSDLQNYPIVRFASENKGIESLFRSKTEKYTFQKFAQEQRVFES